MGERRLRTLFKRARNTIINSTTAAVLVTSSLGGALPVILSGTAFATPADTSFTTSTNYVRENNTGDIDAQIVTPTSSTDIEFFLNGDTSSPIAGVDAGPASTGHEWYRLKTALPAGQYAVSAQVTLSGDTTPSTVNGGTTVYSLDTPSYSYVFPNASTHVFRPSDNPVRVKIDDQYGQFNNLQFNVYHFDGGVLGSQVGGTLTMPRSSCAVTVPATNAVCNLSNAPGWTNLNEGTYKVNLASDTLAHNGLRFTQNNYSVPFTIDNTVPTISNLTITNSAPAYSTPVDVSATATDANGIDSVRFYITAPRASDGVCDGNGTVLGSATDSTGIGSTYSGVLDTSALTGDYCVNAQSADNASHHSAILRQKVTIDNSAPAVPTLTFPVDGVVRQTSNSNHSDWSAVTDPDGPVTYNYESAFDTAFTNLAYGPSSTGTATTIANPGEPEGTYYWRVQACDALGNCSAWSAYRTIHIDNTAPVVSVTPTAGSLLHGTETFHITVNEAHPGNWSHVYVYLYDNGGTQKSKGASVDLSSGSADFTVDTSLLDDGLATFDVGKLTDAAGNSTSVDAGHPSGGDSYFKNYLIDNTAPKITVNSLFTHASTPTVTGTVDDPTANISVQVHGHIYTATNNGDGTWSVDVTNHLTDGVYDVQATATDAAGNVGTDSTTNELIVDTHPASTPILITPLDGSFTNDNTPLLSWLPSLTPNGPVGYEVEVATDSGFTNVVVDHLGSSLLYNSPTLSDGTYYVRVRGTDILGGQSGWSGTHKFTVDTAAPSVQITSPGNGDHVKNTVPVTGTFSDANATAYTWTVVDSHHHIVYFHLAGGTTVNPLSLSSFADGTYTITLEGFDAAGNHTSSTITIVIDDIAPTVAISGPSFTNDNTPTVTGTVDDPDATISINVGGHDYTGTNHGDGTWSADVTHHLNDGHYTVSVTATDLAGNVGTNTASMTVDAHPASTPFLLTPLNNSYISDNTPFVSWLPSLTPNGPVTYDLQIATDSGFTNVVVDHSGNGLTFSPNTALSDGTYYARVNATDHLGGQSSWSGVHQFTIDTVAPHVHIFRPHDGAFVRGTVQLRGYASDSNPNRYAWVITNSHNHIVFIQILQTPPVAPVNWDTTGVADGTYTITLSDSDAALNSNYDSVTVTVDNTAPTISFASPSDGDTVHGTIDVNVDVNDTNLSQYRLRVDGNLVQSDHHAVNGTETYSLDTTTLSDGSHTLKAAARDAAGNWASVTETIVVDNAAPAVPTAAFTATPSGTNVADGGVTNSLHFTFNLTNPASDGVTRYQLEYWNNISGSAFDGQANAWSPTDLSGYSSSLGVYNDQFTQGDGTHFFAFSACDAVGNCSAFSTPFQVTYDSTAPTTPVANPAAGTYTSAQSVTLSSSDTGSGLAGIYYTTDGTTPNNTGNGTLYTGAISVGSSETITAIAYDNAGNASAVLTANYTINIPSPTQPTTPTPNTNDNSDNTDTGNVLSTETTTPNDQNNDGGQVKGANTDKGNNDKSQNSNFLGLGWWWLLVLAAILGGWWFLFGRRRKDDDEN
ncbi:MAG TPA: Ig-like domain-containing protein [Candidatus Saccharimonadales bacterium]|nr:Ig-like domain-containing protein [Candidatus Saccharimonadales bacterium]